MTKAEAIEIMKKDRDLCLFNPITGEKKPMSEDCRKSAEAYALAIEALEQPEQASAQPERLTDDDFETIRIHLNAQKEKLCNQQRWKEAEEYQRIIDRFMAFASAQPEITETQVKEYCEKRCLVVLTFDAFQRLKSAQPERKKGKWIHGRELSREMIGDVVTAIFYEGFECSECNCLVEEELKPLWNFCPNCGADMRGEIDEQKIH